MKSEMIDRETGEIFTPSNFAKPEKKRTLWAIGEDFLDILSKISELLLLGDDESQQAALDTLEGLEGELEGKIERTVKFCENLLLEADQLGGIAATWETRAEGFRAKEKTLHNKVDGYRWMIRRVLLGSQRLDEADTDKKYKAGPYTVKLRLMPESLKIENADLLPADYMKILDPEIDTEKIKKDLKQNIKIPGAILVRKPPKLEVR